jgi:hypothetical protein
MIDRLILALLAWRIRSKPSTGVAANKVVNDLAPVWRPGEK